jgi:hypothetical protein
MISSLLISPAMFTRHFYIRLFYEGFSLKNRKTCKLTAG